MKRVEIAIAVFVATAGSATAADSSGRDFGTYLSALTAEQSVVACGANGLLNTLAAWKSKNAAAIARGRSAVQAKLTGSESVETYEARMKEAHAEMLRSLEPEKLKKRCELFAQSINSGGA